MLDREIIIRKIDSIQNCLQRIGEKTRNNPHWTNDHDIKDIVVINLIRAVQLCVDMAGSLITQQKWGVPKTLAESFVILQKNNVIDNTLYAKTCAK